VKSVDLHEDQFELVPLKKVKPNIISVVDDDEEYSHTTTLRRITCCAALLKAVLSRR